MPTAKHILGCGLSTLGLALGFLCMGRAVEMAVAPDPQPNRKETIAVGLLLGGPTTVGATWMLRALERDRTLTDSQRLQGLFCKILKANSGKIDAIQFALLAEVSFDEAKQCLDAWATTMNADFAIDEAGVTVYCFSV